MQILCTTNKNQIKFSTELNDAYSKYHIFLGFLKLIFKNTLIIVVNFFVNIRSISINFSLNNF